jgi:hypothetical protein
MTRWLAFVVACSGAPTPAPINRPPPATEEPRVADPPPAPVPPTDPADYPDPNTGFDLYVEPPYNVVWSIDGESRTDRLPSRVRGLAPGKHVIGIQPPAPYQPVEKKIFVENGKSIRVDIHLAKP